MGFRTTKLGERVSVKVNFLNLTKIPSRILLITH